MIFNFSGGGANLDLSSITAGTTDVLDGKKFIDADGNLVLGEMPNNGSGGGSISTVSQQVEIPKGYYDGTGYVEISEDERAKIIPENIPSGMTLFGVAGEKPNVKTCSVQITTPNSAGILGYGVTVLRDGAINNTYQRYYGGNAANVLLDNVIVGSVLAVYAAVTSNVAVSDGIVCNEWGAATMWLTFSIKSEGDHTITIT